METENTNIEKKVITTQALTFREKEEIKKRDKYTCMYCGCTNKLLLTIEHKDAKSRGGTNNYSNLGCSCIICNQIKGSLNHTEFKQYYKVLQTLYGMNKVCVNIPSIDVQMKMRGYPGL